MEDGNAAATVPPGEERREYRKGNWTLHETVVLISAKKLDDERRLKGGSSEKEQKSVGTAELRWKWVENYCWRNGCLRSQNQCNDKWDNLLRDYKKVRDYELRLFPGQSSYWQIEKHERKERGLPSNLLYQVYEALREVVDRRYPPRLCHTPSAPDKRSNDTVLLPPLAELDPPHPPASGGGPEAFVEVSGSSESEVQPSSGKRRKVMWRGVSPSATKGTLGLTQTLLACEEKKDKRHRDLLGLEERKLHIEETRTEICRQGIAGLINAVNNLANAILALASDKNMSATD